MDEEIFALKDQKTKISNRFYLTKLEFSEDKSAIGKLDYTILSGNGTHYDYEEYSFDEPHSYSSFEIFWFNFRYYFLKILLYLLLAIVFVAFMIELVVRYRTGGLENGRFIGLLVIYFTFYLFIAIPTPPLSWYNYEAAMKFYYLNDSETAEGMLNTGWWATVITYLLIWAITLFPIFVFSVVLFPIGMLIIFLLWVMYLLPVFNLLIPIILFAGMELVGWRLIFLKEKNTISPQLEIFCIFVTGYHLCCSLIYMVTPNCPSCQGHIVSFVFYLVVYSTTLILGVVALLSAIIRAFVERKN